MSDGRFSIIGIGGAGARLMGAVSALVDADIPLLAVDSDSCSLAESKASTCLQLGESITDGFGTGGDDKLGRQVLDAGMTELLEAVPDVAAVLVVVGLGGGLGSGGVVSAIHALQDAGVMTICFATLPFSFEGAQRKAIANRAVEALEAACDLLIIVRNDNLLSTVDARNLPALFDLADRKLAAAVLALWQTLSRPGFINMDFSDFRRIGQDTAGACMLAYAEAAGDERVAGVLHELLEGPALEAGKLLGRARLLLVSVVGGPDLTLKEIGEVMDALSKAVKPECRVCVGTSIDDTWVGRLTVSIIVGEKRAVKASVAAPPSDEMPPVFESSTMMDSAVSTGTSNRRGGRTQDRVKQGSLPLDRGGRGRFKDVAPTILNGEDLDVPTFIRQRIRVDK